MIIYSAGKIIIYQADTTVVDYDTETIVLLCQSNIVEFYSIELNGNLV